MEKVGKVGSFIKTVDKLLDKLIFVSTSKAQMPTYFLEEIMANDKNLAQLTNQEAILEEIHEEELEEVVGGVFGGLLGAVGGLLGNVGTSLDLFLGQLSGPL